MPENNEEGTVVYQGCTNVSTAQAGWLKFNGLGPNQEAPHSHNINLDWVEDWFASEPEVPGGPVQITVIFHEGYEAPEGEPLQ